MNIRYRVVICLFFVANAAFGENNRFATDYTMRMFQDHMRAVPLPSQESEQWTRSTKPKRDRFIQNFRKALEHRLLDHKKINANLGVSKSKTKGYLYVEGNWDFP